MRQRIILNFLSLVMLFLVAVSCQKDSESILDPTSETVMTSDVKSSMESYSSRIRCQDCPHREQPVCGEDGKTYHNPCFADCAGVRFHPCPDNPCACPRYEQPVCGNDGKTYQNSCFAYCAGTTAVDCEPCICLHVYAPVCGDDGYTYGNACEAECAGVGYVDCNSLLE